VAAIGLRHEDAATRAVSVSIGNSAIHPGDQGGPSTEVELVAIADAGLYVAKENGRGQVSRSPAMTTRAP
jgi:GGDEF domain-containing protein